MTISDGPPLVLGGGTIKYSPNLWNQSYVNIYYYRFCGHSLVGQESSVESGVAGSDRDRRFWILDGQAGRGGF